MIGSCGWAAAGGGSGSIELELRNTGGETLRCVTLLAHFVSMPARLIAPGDTWTSSYFRRPEDGSIFILRDDGREMMVENVICGADTAWAATRGDVPLLVLRSSTTDHVSLSCRADHGFFCDEPG